MVGRAFRRHSTTRTNTMRTLTAIGLGMALLLNTAAQGQDTKATKGNAFEGAYTIVSGEEDGKPIPAHRIEGSSVRITGDAIVVADMDDTDLYVAKYSFDAKKSPAAITMTETGGPRGHKGQKAQGIIKRDGDTVKLCYCYEGGIVPTEFKTKAGENQLCFIMKRKDKATK
jgi:uncharacterized protein (TIGR03067 family)